MTLYVHVFASLGHDRNMRGACMSEDPSVLPDEFGPWERVGGGFWGSVRPDLRDEIERNGFVVYPSRFVVFVHK